MRPLLVVWELATDDYGYFTQFRPAVRIAGICENRGIPLRFLFARDVAAYLARLTSDTTTAPLPGYSPPSNEARAPFRDPSAVRCLIRGMTDPARIASLEKAGIPCVNGSRATRIANDKLESAHLARRLGIPTPLAFPADGAVWNARNPAADPPEGLAYPLVIKPRFGSRGRCVTLATTREEAVAAIQGLEDRGERALAQEYVAASRGRDLRVFFSGNRIVAVACRINPAGGLVSNAAEGGLMRRASLPDPAGEWERAAFALAGEAGLLYGSADFLYTGDGGLTLCEINAAPGFEALESACGIDVAGAVIDAATEWERPLTAR